AAIAARFFCPSSKSRHLQHSVRSFLLSPLLPGTIPTMTEPEAVAIRYDKLKTAPKGVAGSWPVVVFTEQDQVLAQASLFPETEAERAPSIASEIRNLIFVLDSSSSMNQRAGGGTSQSKFDYLKSQFRKISPEILESSKVHFIEFSSEATAEEVDLS